jgi:hypothetical protein
MRKFDVKPPAALLVTGDVGTHRNLSTLAAEGMITENEGSKLSVPISIKADALEVLA